GEFIGEKLKDYGIKQDFVKVAGETRSCLAIITDDGAQTEILEPGPVVTAEEQEAFLLKYRELLSKASVVVASGSMPQGLPKNFYATLIEIAKAEHKPFLLDTSGEALVQGIAAMPYFIKPNTDEIRAIKGTNIDSDEDVVREVQLFMADGIKLPVVSLGARGSIAGYNNHVYRVTVPKIQCKNPVGSGDSFVAGIAVGIERGMAIEDILSLGAACGTANAMEDESGFVRKEVVDELFGQIKIEQLV
ncbi:1-phosphofructokinase family hexose kinase, partial [Anaerovibrio slackiae]